MLNSPDRMKLLRELSRTPDGRNQWRLMQAPEGQQDVMDELVEEGLVTVALDGASSGKWYRLTVNGYVKARSLR